MSAEQPAAGTGKPFLEITRGNPTAREVGILTALFAVAEGNAAGGDQGHQGPRDRWGSLEERLRPPFGYNPSSFRNRRQF